jgi:hypothetical protein
MCLTIQEFLNKYGTDSTSNFDLMRWAKELNIKPFKVLMRNELKRSRKTLREGYIICNYQTTEDGGTHWVCFTPSFYFDSYGIQPFPEVKSFLKNGAVYSTFRIQPDSSKMCGQLCLYVLYKLSKGNDFYDTIFGVVWCGVVCGVHLLSVFCFLFL